VLTISNLFAHATRCTAARYMPGTTRRGFGDAQFFPVTQCWWAWLSTGPIEGEE